MTFDIAVFIKQVPDTNDIRWTEHNTIQREGLDSVINPYDLGAIQLAKNVKMLNQEAKITVITMGPQQAKDVLKQALALGCDEAVLLSDKKFSGADTLATAYTLSQFIKTQMTNVKLIICGQMAVDGDTAQTPSSMAEKLSMVQITNVIGLKSVNENESVWFKDTCEYKQEIKVQHPAVIATSLCNIDFLADINGHIKAQNTEIKLFSADDIQADYEHIGLKGSPTIVKNAYRAQIERTTELIENISTEDCANFIFEEISKCRVKND